MASNDFNLRALYTALDSQRQARGLSWAQVAKEINRRSEHSSAHSLSPSTISGLQKRNVAEGDGVLQMLLWLNRTPESFMSGDSESEKLSTRLPEVPPRKVLRFDTRKLHAALDAQRTQKKMTWAQVANQVGVGVSSLTHLSRGGRTGFPQVMRIVRWLGRPAADFTRLSDR